MIARLESSSMGSRPYSIPHTHSLRMKEMDNEQIRKVSSSKRAAEV